MQNALTCRISGTTITHDAPISLSGINPLFTPENYPALETRFLRNPNSLTQEYIAGIILYNLTTKGYIANPQHQDTLRANHALQRELPYILKKMAKRATSLRHTNYPRITLDGDVCALVRSLCYAKPQILTATRTTKPTPKRRTASLNIMAVLERVARAAHKVPKEVIASAELSSGLTLKQARSQILLYSDLNAKARTALHTFYAELLTAHKRGTTMHRSIEIFLERLMQDVTPVELDGGYDGWL